MPTWAAGNVELSDEFGGWKNTTSGGKKKLTSLRDNEKKRYFQSVYLDPTALSGHCHMPSNLTFTAVDVKKRALVKPDPFFVIPY